MMKREKLPVIIIGGGGHAKVVADVLKLNNYPIVGIVDCNGPEGLKIKDIPYLGTDDAVFQYLPQSILLANGVGSIGSTERRESVFNFFQGKDYHFVKVVHPSSVIAADVIMGEGVQVMAGAVIQPGSILGCNVVINTRASVDHDCNIGNHTHIAPGAILSGGVQVESGVHIGTGAVVLQGTYIGEQAVVGAGTVVIQDVLPHSTMVGVPARLVK